MKEITDGYLLRIFFNDKDNINGEPLSHRMLKEAHQRNLRGATLLRAIAGFGKSRVIHSTGILAMSEAVPLVLEICDAQQTIKNELEFFKTLLDQADGGAFLTLEKIRGYYT